MSGPILGVAGPPATGYYAFIRQSMGIPVSALPDDDFWIPASYNLSLDIVNINLSLIPQVGSLTYPNQYAIAVYNLGGDRIVNLKQDPLNNDGTPVTPFPGSNPPVGYFTYLRKQFHVDAFVSGVITYTTDVTTGASFQVPEWAKNLTIGDLQNLKTPWGRVYMAIAQSYGPTVVGIT